MMYIFIILISILSLISSYNITENVDLSLNTTSSYNPDLAVSFANSYCAKDEEWLCAEFVSRALHAAGEFPGVTDYFNYNGYNLASTSSLHKYLLNNGWEQVAGGGKSNCGNYGNVLIYDVDGDPDAHTVLAIGNCLRDQHNPGRCGANAAYGDANIVLAKKT